TASVAARQPDLAWFARSARNAVCRRLRRNEREPLAVGRELRLQRMEAGRRVDLPQPAACDDPQRVARDERQAAVAGERGDVHGRATAHANDVRQAAAASERDSERDTARRSSRDYGDRTTAPALACARLFDQQLGILALRRAERRRRENAHASRSMISTISSAR